MVSRCLSPCLATLLVLGGGLGAAPAHASQDSPPQISDVTVQHSVHVDGLEVGYVDITARIVSADGLARGYPDQYTTLRYPYVEITRDPGPARWFDGSPWWWPMDLISGDEHDGVWRARVPFTSTAVGRWHVGAVEASDTSSGYTRQQVTDGAITVQSSEWPHLMWTSSPAVQGVNDSGRDTYSGRLLWTDGEPVAGATLRWAVDIDCLEHDNVIPPQHTLRTDAAGRWSFTVWRGGIVCLGYDAPAPEATTGGSPAFSLARYGVAGLRVAYQYSVSTPADTAGALGHPVAVNGKVYPYLSGFGGRVLLQRYTAGRWKTVGSAPVRSSGRYTLTAQPPYAGRHAYRVWKPSDDCTEGHCLELGTVSATFAVLAR